MVNPKSKGKGKVGGNPEPPSEPPPERVDGLVEEVHNESRSVNELTRNPIMMAGNESKLSIKEELRPKGERKWPQLGSLQWRETDVHSFG